MLAFAAMLDPQFSWRNQSKLLSFWMQVVTNKRLIYLIDLGQLAGLKTIQNAGLKIQLKKRLAVQFLVFGHAVKMMNLISVKNCLIYFPKKKGIYFHPISTSYIWTKRWTIYILPQRHWLYGIRLSHIFEIPSISNEQSSISIKILSISIENLGFRSKH